MTQTFEVLVFDLDGTLIYRAPNIHAAIVQALSNIERAPLD